MTVWSLAFALFIGLTAERWFAAAISAILLYRSRQRFQQENQALLKLLDRSLPPDLTDSKLTVN
jgi:hypothetical protein